MNSNVRIIVAGLSRSGTSMIMQMLDQGGYPIVFNTPVQKDKHNPNGYFNNKASTAVKNNLEVIENAGSSAFKIYSAQIQFLPVHFQYKVIHITRDIFEIRESRQRINKDSKKNAYYGFFAIKRREEMKLVQNKVQSWVDQNGYEALTLSYSDVIGNPTHAATRISNFLDSKIDIEKMANAVDPNLYHSKGKVNYLVTDRAPIDVAKIIKEYSEGKVYCEIGIGEGHILNKVDNTEKSFGVENSKYGIAMCKELYPNLDIIHDDIFNVLDKIEFDICYLWIVYPFSKNIVDKILEQKPNAIICHGLNYTYHLPENDPKRLRYEATYPKKAQPEIWNEQINIHLKQLRDSGISIEIKEVVGENDEVFSIAIINA